MKMFRHYLTVALRGMERYKLQTIVSVVGLAVGFVCLSLSALWLRYDNTYNTDLPIDAPERTYALGGEWRSGEFTLTVPGGLRQAMNEWPEVEAWCLNEQSTVDLEIDGVEEEVAFIDIDKTFANFFHFDVVYGPADFWTANKGGDAYHLALSESFARRESRRPKGQDYGGCRGCHRSRCQGLQPPQLVHVRHRLHPAR